MFRTSPGSVCGTTEIDSTIMQGTARLCRSDFATMLKAVQPYKTAEWLATNTKQSVRAAAYELSGDREPSARSIAFLVSIAARWPL